MSLKNVVKVMNFHSLLRVERSRRAAKKYSQMEGLVLEMLDNILHNRNVILDIRALQVKKDMPQLCIFLGSDLGFCGNLNNLVRRRLSESAQDCEVITVGKKLRYFGSGNVLLHMTREDFVKDHRQLLEIMGRGLRNKSYSAIRLVYNHYHNSSEVEFVDKVIFPMPAGLFGEKMYTEDFVCEGDMQEILVDLVELYLVYELEIAAQVSLAAENITRQNITTESLKKIDERDELARQAARRARKDKEFAKVLDNYTKLNHY